MRIQKGIARTFSPLNATCDLVVEGGALHQIFRPDTDEYSPDRAITPLTIRPVIRVVDMDGVFGDGIANPRLGEIKWLAGKANVSGNSKYVIDTTATVNKGSLTVYQNVPAGSALTLYFEGVIPDGRNGTSLKVNGSVLLNTNVVSKEKVTVEIDQPAVMIFNPVTDPAEVTIKATVYLADGIQPAANTRLWWYTRRGDGTLSPVDPGDDLEYISGVNTPALKIDRRYIDKIKDYRLVADFVKTGSVAPPVPTARAAFVDFSVRRKYPAWEVDIQTYGNLTASQRAIKAKAIITAGRTTLDDPERYYSIRWYSVDTSGVERRYGFGGGQEIPAGIAGIATGGVDIGADIIERESLKALAVGGVVITIGGKIITV